MADEKEEHSKMERHSSNDSRFLHFHEVNQQHCNIDNASNNELVFEARLENVDNLCVGGGAPLSHVSINQTPDVDKQPDLYQLLLQTQMITQALLNNERTDSNTPVKKNKCGKRRTTCTVSASDDASPSSSKKQRYETESGHGHGSRVQSESLTQSYMKELQELCQSQNNKQNQREASPLSDVSSESESESSNNSDNELDQQEIHTNINSNSTSNKNNDTMSVIEDMKGFMVTEEKAGPKINDELASVVNDGLRKKAKQNKVDELTKKYAKPENVHSLTVPKINLGIWSQMSISNRMNDVKLQKIQNLLGKAACPMLYLMDMFLGKSQTNDGLTAEEVHSATQLCKDAYQMTQVTYADITFRRRALIQAEIQPKYKALCKDDVPVTDFLFGNDIKDKVKEMDAEYTVGKKLGKTNFNVGKKSHDDKKTFKKPYVHVPKRHFDKPSNKKDFLGKPTYKKKKFKKKFQEQDKKF
ncbi:uncharacterized protein LOC143085636 [Mytilus galloprovincialis]|uniref:uncharacterized protein LOC143085636 n=1 Tax=Mytilus galloprovincialis TaxID=29158 RepID=UPI003F7BEC70